MGKTYRHIKRPLFVLLNDFHEIRKQFALVSKVGESIASGRLGGRNRLIDGGTTQVSEWIAMAYPTWLLFLRDGSRFEDFLSDVYVPFDCILMVAQRDAGGSGEMVRDVYRIGKGEVLESMTFGEWDEARGFRGPRLGLYQRRHDLHGRNIRVVSVDVSARGNGES